MSIRNTPQRRTCFKLGSRRLEDGLHVFQALFGLRRGVRAHELAGRRIGRALARHEDETLEPHPR